MPPKITVDELKAAVNPTLIRDFGAETQLPRIAAQIVDDEARYHGDRNKWFDGSQDKKAIVQRFEQLLRTELLTAWVQKSHGRYEKVGAAGAAPIKIRFVAPSPKFATSLVQM